MHEGRVIGFWHAGVTVSDMDAALRNLAQNGKAELKVGGEPGFLERQTGLPQFE